MRQSISEIHRNLTSSQNMLNRTVKDALSKFRQHKDILDEINPYLDEWGNKSVHDFMFFCVNSDAEESPDITSGEMCPFNFFRVLWPLYAGYER